MLQLNDGNFLQALEEHAPLLVAFTAPWCGHCKRLHPEMEKAAELLEDREPEVTLAMVDCEAANSRKVKKQRGTQSLPTLKFYTGR